MKDAVDFEEAKKFWVKEGKKKYTLLGKGENSSRYCEEEREMIEWNEFECRRNEDVQAG